jgi:DnaJ-class molecular chaperone
MLTPRPTKHKPANDGSGLSERETVACPMCGGTGRRLWQYAIEVDCETCGGSGRVSDIKAGQLARMHE